MYPSTESIKALNHEGIGKVQQKIPLFYYYFLEIYTFFTL